MTVLLAFSGIADLLIGDGMPVAPGTEFVPGSWGSPVAQSLLFTLRNEGTVLLGFPLFSVISVILSL